MPNASRDQDSNSQTSQLLNAIMPRKYSHINRLAQGLIFNDCVYDQSSAFQKENNLNLQRVPIDIAAVKPGGIFKNQNSTKNQQENKLSTIRFKKRRNSSKVFVGSFVAKNESKEIIIKNRPSL